jgi:hypothetical protein
MTDLRDAADRIAATRGLYNGNVARYNTKLKSFPASLLGRRASMAPAELFELARPEHAAVPMVRSDQS